MLVQELIVPKKRLIDQIIILLAAGFEENATITMLHQMRQVGLPVSLVSLTGGLVTGEYGVAIQPDYTLEQLRVGTAYRMIIVPGGSLCTTSLAIDPRVHRLLASSLNNAGFVAILSKAESLLAQFGLSPKEMRCHNLIFKKEKCIHLFADTLVELFQQR